MHRPRASRNCLCEPRCLISEKPSLMRIETTSADLSIGTLPTDLSYSNVLHPYELGFEYRLAIFKEHSDYFLEVAIDLVQRFALRVCARETRNETDKKARLGATFDNSRINFHDPAPEGNMGNYPPESNTTQLETPNVGGRLAAISTLDDVLRDIRHQVARWT